MFVYCQKDLAWMVLLSVIDGFFLILYERKGPPLMVAWDLFFYMLSIFLHDG